VSRRRKLLVFLLVALLTGGYALWRAPEWGARGLEHALSRYFQRQVQVRALHLHPRTFEIEIEGLRVAGPDAASPPFLEAPRVRVRPSLAPLRVRRLVLARVRVEGLRVRIRAFPNPPLGPGGDDIPKLGGGVGGRGLEISVER
jgi:hypothetical protein